MATLKGAIITGAASGVGLALTKHLLSKGWHVVMSDINEAGDGIAKELGGKILWVKADIGVWEGVEALFTKGTSTFFLLT